MQLGVQSLVAPSLQITESPSKLIQRRWLTLLRLPSHIWSKCTRETNPYVSDNLILIYPSIHMFSHLLSASVFRKDSVSGFANSQILFKTVVLGQFAPNCLLHSCGLSHWSSLNVTLELWQVCLRVEWLLVASPFCPTGHRNIFWTAWVTLKCPGEPGHEDIQHGQYSKICYGKEVLEPFRNRGSICLTWALDREMSGLLHLLRNRES